jgi:uncharacterized protein YjbI with pentapeptide repeats
MILCEFTDRYYNYQIDKWEIYNCDQEPLSNNKLCLFHDEQYLKDCNNPKNKENVIRKLDEKINNSILNNVPLVCIGYYIPEIKINKEFNQQVYFKDCKFQRVNFNGSTFSAEVTFSYSIFSDEANFSRSIFYNIVNFNGSTFNNMANFYGSVFKSRANFYGSVFKSRANFYGSVFSSKDATFFNSVIFEKPTSIIFEVDNMSKVSFLNTDITRIRFGSRTRWGGLTKYKIIEEEWFEKLFTFAPSNINEDMNISSKIVSLEDVLSVYRNLRENYEFRLRFKDAGQFFIREMDLNRTYKEIKSSYELVFPFKRKSWLHRNLFSLIGWYRILSNYGESLVRPTVLGISIIFLFTIFFVVQSNPYQEPFSNIFLTSSNTSYINNNNNSKHTISAITDNSTVTSNFSRFIGFEQTGNPAHWLKSFIRTTGDFIPLLPMPSDIKIGLTDYIIKIFGGAITFGLIVIALRRRLERKYTR